MEVVPTSSVKALAILFYGLKSVTTMIMFVMMKTNMKVMVGGDDDGMKMERGGDLPVTGSCTVRHSRPPTDMFANFTWSLGFRIVIIIIVIIIAIKNHNHLCHRHYRFNQQQNPI